MADPKPHSRDLRAHRHVGPGETFFITKTVEGRRKVLTETPDGCPAPATIITEAFAHYASQATCHLAAFVVMPDHWHALFGLPVDQELAGFMKALDRWLGRSIRLAAETRVQWQDGYYDSRVVSNRQFRYYVTYIEQNPVRSELVPVASEWRWSSSHPEHSDVLTRPGPWAFERP